MVGGKGTGGLKPWPSTKKPRTSVEQLVSEDRSVDVRPTKKPRTSAEQLGSEDSSAEVRHTMSPFPKLRGSLFMSTRLIVDMYAMWNPSGVISEFPFGVAPPFVNRERLPHLCRACCWFDLCFTSSSYLITGHACLHFAFGTLQVSLHATWPRYHSF